MTSDFTILLRLLTIWTLGVALLAGSTSLPQGPKNAIHAFIICVPIYIKWPSTLSSVLQVLLHAFVTFVINISTTCALVALRLIIHCIINPHDKHYAKFELPQHRNAAFYPEEGSAISDDEDDDEDYSSDDGTVSDDDSSVGSIISSSFGPPTRHITPPAQFTPTYYHTPIQPPQLPRIPPLLRITPLHPFPQIPGTPALRRVQGHIQPAPWRVGPYSYIVTGRRMASGVNK